MPNPEKTLHLGDFFSGTVDPGYFYDNWPTLKDLRVHLHGLVLMSLENGVSHDQISKNMECINRRNKNWEEVKNIDHTAVRRFIKALSSESGHKDLNKFSYEWVYLLYLAVASPDLGTFSFQNSKKFAAKRGRGRRAVIDVSNATQERRLNKMYSDQTSFITLLKEEFSHHHNAKDVELVLRHVSLFGITHIINMSILLLDLLDEKRITESKIDEILHKWSYLSRWAICRYGSDGNKRMTETKHIQQYLKETPWWLLPLTPGDLRKLPTSLARDLRRDQRVKVGLVRGDPEKKRREKPVGKLKTSRRKKT